MMGLNIINQIIMSTLSISEQQEQIRQKAYAEALRYMNNAVETLQKAGKEDRYYKDGKYVSTACGTAYKGVLLALDTFLMLKGVEMPKKNRRSIEFYTYNIARIDKKLGTYLKVAYDTLHLSGYYDGTLVVATVKEGFDVAYEIIARIKPTNPLTTEQLERLQPPFLKRIYTFLFV
jgi:hypothetical protein